MDDDPVRVAGQEEDEETTEQYAETNTHESGKSILEGSLIEKLVAELAGRSLQVLPAVASPAVRTNGARARTARHFAPVLLVLLLHQLPLRIVSPL